MPTLGELPAGSHATVTALAGDPALVQRLYELGLLEGERVEVVARAPLGEMEKVSTNSLTLTK